MFSSNVRFLEIVLSPAPQLGLSIENPPPDGSPVGFSVGASLAPQASEAPTEKSTGNPSGGGVFDEELQSVDM